MRDYTRNQFARRLDMMEEWSKTSPKQSTSTDCPPAAVRVHNINTDRAANSASSDIYW